MQIVSAARELLEEEGCDALTMRALADRLGIRAPSLYKHFSDKAAVEAALIERGLMEIDAVLYGVLEEWSGTPFFLAAGDPYLAQALWSFAHGMVILELDGRYPEGSDLERTWAEGARAFAARRASIG
ncbi:TetR/AcrR family transcriptional regulator [Planomonospora parontospora]|uniref:TetR/AcrR family transcriptional regulator n=1 Tax=Planomonospora parontospora TaxID=58119 RepID=UPI001986B1DB|nr:TetR/AcrR family transcriptional regulator [Planomonospora parontospora]GGL32638.1 TetR family transcriptional regulator [Planomonospora parontospora subsp. antibiotica]GII17037.1 TetR family transcriptional regulator [Planomonospora parontospora subsp. antibiotica]